MGAKLILATIFYSLISPFAVADQMGPHGDRFYEEAAHFTNACLTSPCAPPYSSALLYDQQKRINALSVEQRTLLKQVAWDQAQIWGDTILEGDYTSSGKTRLDSVIAFYKNGELVGFKIQYSEKAWYTGECDYNGTPGTLKDCKEGRIEESSYVSPDFKTFFSDENKPADFKPEV